MIYERLVKEILDESKLDTELISSQQSLDSALLEQEKLEQDLNYEKNARQKLDSYCAELRNKHNQIIEDANKLSEDERQKRIQISTTFQADITEKSKRLEETCYKRAENTKYNEILKEKMKELMGFVEERDTTFNSMLEEKTKELEEYKAKIDVKPNPEEENLREELEEYKNKFEVFQNSLTESNQHFSSFKKDMDGKAKQVKALQKDNMELKKKEKEFNDTLSVLREEVDNLIKMKQKLEGDFVKLTELKKKLGNQ